MQQNIPFSFLFSAFEGIFTQRKTALWCCIYITGKGTLYPACSIVYWFLCETEVPNRHLYALLPYF